VPTQFYSAVPYLITIIILAGVVGRSMAPASVGRPFSREKRERRAPRIGPESSEPVAGS
jgi:hypothetical protein